MAEYQHRRHAVREFRIPWKVTKSEIISTSSLNPGQGTQKKSYKTKLT
jgi:hypothetical protein